MLPLITAKKIAVEIGNRLLPFCDRLNIAGSIRRSKAECGDIELVCQPKRVKTGQVDLFGVDTTAEVVHAEFVRIVSTLGNVIKGKPDGRMMQIEVNNNYGGAKTIMLDLFMPMPYDYYRQYAIRTGSADYSAKVIAKGWVNKGWVGTPDGLRLDSECQATLLPDGKRKYKCLTDNPTLPPEWQSEQEFFERLNVQYLPPSVRFIT